MTLALTKRNNTIAAYIRLIKRVYKKARNDVNASIRVARTNFFNESFKKHSGNLKETWKVVNSSLGRNCKVTLINELVYEGKKKWLFI